MLPIKPKTKKKASKHVTTWPRIEQGSPTDLDFEWPKCDGCAPRTARSLLSTVGRRAPSAPLPERPSALLCLPLSLCQTSQRGQNPQSTISRPGKWLSELCASLFGTVRKSNRTAAKKRKITTWPRVERGSPTDTECDCCLNATGVHHAPPGLWLLVVRA
jgi:hypothetical protein